MKPGLVLPPPGKTFKDLYKQGMCVICKIPLYGWEDKPRELCGDPECDEEYRRTRQGKRKIKNPCRFPRLRDKATP